MSVTRARIAKAIKKATGLDGEIFCGGGVCHFYSDIDPVLSDLLHDKDKSTVMVCYLNQLTISEWVAEFKEAIK
tara:strand:+ start:323 stop:544 length:222 start_codon:yes stop_codon:yes gene_type:complete